MNTGKVADFGFAAELPSANSGRTILTAPMLANTNGYSPPEYRSGRYSTKSDAYSYGVVSYYCP